MSTLPGTSDPNFLSVLEELCASPRYRNRRAFQKNRDEYMIARPDRAILQLLSPQEALALDCRRMQKT
jgi:hypothetical protein